MPHASDALDSLLASNDEAPQLQGLALAFAEPLSGGQLAAVIAAGMFSEHAAVRKNCKTRLSAHPQAALAAFFKGEKRNYFSIEDGGKLRKLVDELKALGVDPAQLTQALVRVEVARNQAFGFGAKPSQLEAALAVEGSEEAVFTALAELDTVLLPKCKKSVFAGLSHLKALRKLSIHAESLTSAANLDELARIPQRFFLQLNVKNVKLALFDSLKHNVSGLGFWGAASALTDISPLSGWQHLETLSLDGNEVTELAPLAKLPLRSLSLDHTKVADLSALASIGTLTHLTLWGAVVPSLEPLTGLPLVSLRIAPAGLPDLEPLARIATLTELDISGAPADARGLQALQAARPGLSVKR